MADEGSLKASVTDEMILNDNLHNGLDNLNFPDIKHEEEDDPSLWNPSVVDGTEFANSNAEELFEHIPELKEIFHIKSKIGEGTFSNVYLASVTENPDQLVALKHIIPTSAPDRVEREVRCLLEMGGLNNVIGYKGTLRNRDHSAIILPYFPHDKFQDYLKDMAVPDICDYMKNLMQALKHIHSFSIIHRDVKPGNFLHSRKTRRYNLVDFGLAMHEPGSDKAWDIEIKKGEPVKKVNRKNVRVLSPESCKTVQATKKLRISPRLTRPSHKFMRQAPATTKTSLKSSLKNSQVSKAGANEQMDTSTKYTRQDTKLVQKSTNSEQNNLQKQHLETLRSSSGLCATNHKKTDVCSLCMKRSTQNAPRAGTSGFRAPEVLMKHPQQTTAVDIWSAGVMMLCLLSGKYPFFRCYDDMTALAQIISLFGKQRVMASSKHIGKYLVCNSISAGYELKTVCQKLRSCSGKEGETNSMKCCVKCNKKKIKTKKCKDEESSSEQNSRTISSRKASVPGSITNDSASNGKTKLRFLSSGHLPPTEKQRETTCDPLKKDSVHEHLDGSECSCVCGSCAQYVPKSAYDFLERCLDLNPDTRITASEALEHPFLINCRNSPPPDR